MYIYITPEFDKKMCEAFNVEYTPKEIQKIKLECTNKSLMPPNIGIDIGVKGKEPWNKGKKTGPLSQEQKDVLSLAAKGYNKTDQHKNNLSTALKGNQNGKSNTKPKSDAHKQKIRESILKKMKR